ncbi:c-type cytochrome [Undibacterium sp. Ji49W]|uniref:c-type cytochrome n=1 Tax=Undibacterium sp. Ji49W TaxID=3413040 RepID=UPI003BF0A4D6
MAAFFTLTTSATAPASTLPVPSQTQRATRGLTGWLRSLAVCLLPISMLVMGADALAGAAGANAGTTGDIQQGRALYEARCFGCHSMDANRIGPKHANLIGRKAGSISDFEYSPALRGAKIVWNEKTLDRWLQDPESYVPGQQMDVSVSKAEDRKNLIAYLKTLSMKTAKK